MKNYKISKQAKGRGWCYPKWEEIETIRAKSAKSAMNRFHVSQADKYDMFVTDHASVERPRKGVVIFEIYDGRYCVEEVD
jgi:hypothetical protein